MKARIYFLDNLRTFLIFLVVLLHAGMTYESGFDSFWIVSDPAKLNPIALVRMYLDLFIMFVMFFVSGYFVPNSLKNKSGRQFLISKFRRIFIPWIVAVFTLIPAYKAIFLYSRGLPQQEWFSYFHLFQRAGSDLSFYANNPTQSWLWFLPVLFLFQVVYLAMSKINLLKVKMSLKTGVVLTFVIGLVYSMIISNSGLKGWAHSPIFDFQRERLLVYFMVFLLGSLCARLKVFESAIKTQKYYITSSIVLIISLGIYTAVALNFFFNIIDPARNHFYISDFVDRVGYYSSTLLAMLSFMYILIHSFRQSFNKNYKIMAQLNKNSYQVYIIHMVVLGVLAVILVNITIPAFLKYIVLTVATFAISSSIVTAYQRLFKQNTILKLSTLSVIVVAFAAIIQYGGIENKVWKKNIVSQVQTEVVAPGMSLHEAAFRGELEVIQQHISAGSDVNLKDANDGGSPLNTAAAFGKTEVVMALIKAGANVNAIKNDGSTPLHTAAFFCRTEIVQILLDNGADKNIRNNAGSTALESVLAPFEAVKGIYDYLGKALGPLGLQLDYEQLKSTRPIIAEMISKS